jgi:hypothetical protein
MVLVTHETTVKYFQEFGFHLRRVSQKQSHHFMNMYLIIIIITIELWWWWCKAKTSEQMGDKFTYNVPEEEEEDGGKSEHQATLLSAMKGTDVEEIPYKL